MPSSLDQLTSQDVCKHSCSYIRGLFVVVAGCTHRHRTSSKLALVAICKVDKHVVSLLVGQGACIHLQSHTRTQQQCTNSLGSYVAVSFPPSFCRQWFSQKLGTEKLGIFCKSLELFKIQDSFCPTRFILSVACEASAVKEEPRVAGPFAYQLIVPT